MHIRSCWKPIIKGGTGKKKLIKNIKIKKRLYLVAIGIIKTCKKFWNKHFYQKCVVYCVQHFSLVLVTDSF